MLYPVPNQWWEWTRMESLCCHQTLRYSTRLTVLPPQETMAETDGNSLRIQPRSASLRFKQMIWPRLRPNNEQQKLP